MADQATQAAQLKAISDNVQLLWMAMQRSAKNVAGLLQVGRATCEVVKAHNLWSLATYRTQVGMLATLRANGEQGVPELPQSPTLFGWRGVPGEAAFQIDCSKEKNLSGAAIMAKALRGPTSATTFLSSNEMEMVTQNPYALNPEAAPSFKLLYDVQQARQQQQDGLGAFPIAAVFIAISIFTVGVGVALHAIMGYLETNEVQESHSKQVALQASAFADYIAATLECFKTCTGQGGKTDACVASCDKLVEKPNIILPGQGKPWGWLQWTGFTVVVGAGALMAHRIWSRKREGKPVFELPDFPG